MRKKSFRFKMFVGMLAVVSLFLVSDVFAGNPVWTITANTTLQANWDGRIVFGANRISLNCNGYEINGWNEFQDGITIYGRSTVYVKNCNIHNFVRDGIRITNSSSVFILNNQIHDNNGHGIFAQDSSSLRLGKIDYTGNTVYFNENAGVYFNNVTNADLYTNNFSLNGDEGLFTAFGSDLFVNELSTWANGACGSRLGAYYYDERTNDLNLKKITSTENGEDGISINFPDVFLLENSNINDNEGEGIMLQSQSDGTISNTTARGNGGYDFWDWYGWCNPILQNVNFGNVCVME